MREDLLDLTEGVRDVEPIQSRVVTVLGYRMHCLVAGRGEPVLLLHGLADHAETWARIVPRLAPRYHVVAPDLLGCGLSDKPSISYTLWELAIYLRYLMDAIGIERAHVVGHSLGGGLALHLYFQYPERVRDLALIASGGMGRQLPLGLRLCTLAGSSSVLSALLASRHGRHPIARVGRTVLERFWPATAIADGARMAADSEEALVAEEEAGVLDRLRDPHARAAFLAMLRSNCDVRGQHARALDALARVTVPVLLIHGQQDATIPVSHSRAAFQALRQGTLEELERCGHCPHREMPGRVAHLIQNFLSGPEAVLAG